MSITFMKIGKLPCSYCKKIHVRNIRRRRAWTKEEDERLINYIKVHGEGFWKNVPINAGISRCGKDCRARWMECLRPDINRATFTDQEDDLLIKLHRIFGNRWSQIAKRLPGRTDNDIKKYWRSNDLQRKLRNRGIDLLACRSINGQAAVVHEAENSQGDEKVAERLRCNNQSDQDGEVYPELNLELTLSPPGSLF